MTPATLTSVLLSRSVSPASDAAPSFRRQKRSPMATDGRPSTAATSIRPARAGGSAIEK